jgi:hypothetical protein
MPRKRTLSKSRLSYHEAHFVQLRTGVDFFGDAFGDLKNPDGTERLEVLQAMQAAWRDLRDEVMARDRRHWKLFHRPWVWWRFDRNIEHPPRDKDEQRKYLILHKLLDAEEKAALAMEGKDTMTPLYDR